MIPLGLSPLALSLYCAFAEVFTSSLMGGLLRRTAGLSELDRDGWIREIVGIFVCGIGAVKPPDPMIPANFPETTEKL